MPDLLEHTRFDIKRKKGRRLEKSFEIFGEAGGRVGEVREEGISGGQSLLRLWTGRGGAATRLIVVDDTDDPVLWVSGLTQKPMLVWDAEGKLAGRIVAQKGRLHSRWDLQDAEGQHLGSLEKTGLLGPFRFRAPDGTDTGFFTMELTSGKELAFGSSHHEVLNVEPEASRELRAIMVAMAVSHADAQI